MTSTLRRYLFIFGLAMLTTLAVAGRAEAGGGYGYVCSTVFYPYAGPQGNYGYNYVTVYTGAGCSGTLLVAGMFCSLNHTNTNCESGFFTDVGLNTLSQNFQRAAAANQKVYASWNSTTLNPYFIYFYAQ